MSFLTLAYILNWGWLRIGPPYIYINIDPILVHIGPLAVRWYGLMYVVAILMALWIVKGYTERKGIHEDILYRTLWWCIAAGLIGGRLYFVVQQPDLVSTYLMHPLNIIATWNGGMAFYGAIFLGFLTLIWRARREHLNALVLLDAGVLFAAVGQIFGRIGNLINGDIIGYPTKLPWGTVYQNPNSWACLDPTTCNVPVQPAAAYEMLGNIVVLALMFYLARRVRRPGILMFTYLFCYTISQFLVFFVRANIYVSFLGTTFLKQAQWTSIIVFICVIPVTYWVMRYSKPVPEDAAAATYGVPQPSLKASVAQEKPLATSPEATTSTEAVPDEAPADTTSIDAESTTATEATESTESIDAAPPTQEQAPVEKLVPDKDRTEAE
ncbi:prolipoprotein diacylglyceryl transferase [Ktedonobacteria bacterium brp13]|nr:prolipoprotein diacylglyceryl transferase [Ktedonobacteria bacterium brp13]